MRIKFLLVLAIAIFTFPLITFSQESAGWTKWDKLLGDWVGEGSGKPGQGDGTFTFKTDLDNKILIRKGHTEFQATDKKPASTHDDLMIISLDSKNIPSKAVYFDNESHTINYNISYAGDTIVLTSEKIFNFPVFRLNYLLLDNETVNIKFEMSRDGVSFMTYIEGISKKRK